MDGSVQWEKAVDVDSVEDSVVDAFRVERPVGLTPLYFLRLKLTRGDELVSENLYWRGLEAGDLRAVRSLGEASVEATTTTARDGQRWRLTTELRNTSASPALMVRLKAVREKSGDRILPAIYSDNYVSIMPGEVRTVVTEIIDADTRGEPPAIRVEGVNVGDGSR
jgi:hypothetical protein